MASKMSLCARHAPAIDRAVEQLACEDFGAGFAAGSQRIKPEWDARARQEVDACARVTEGAMHDAGVGLDDVPVRLAASSASPRGHCVGSIAHEPVPTCLTGTGIAATEA